MAHQCITCGKRIERLQRMSAARYCSSCWKEYLLPEWRLQTNRADADWKVALQHAIQLALVQPAVIPHGFRLHHQ